MSRYRGEDICDVCGDKTLCKNFSVNACESCKAFFRRAIRDNRIYKCSQNGNCNVNKMTRTLCKLCRFNKCLAIGMRREFVRSNEENKMRRKMIAENRLKDNLNDAKSVDLSPMSTASDVSTHSDQPYSPKDQNFLNELIDKTVNISDEELTQQILEIDINLSVNEINANERIVKVNIDLKPEETAIIPIIRPLDNRNDWNCLETNRIAELLSATKIFDHKLPENLVAVNNFKEFIYNYHDKLENSIIEVANFTKILNGFANICSEDQLSLVKNSCLEVILLREAMYYNNEVDSHCMKMNDHNTIVVKVDVYKNVLKVPYYSRLRLFIDKFVPHCKHDPIIADLLTAIVLYNPNHPQLKHKHTVKLEQQLYIYLLQRYLLLKYRNECESHSYLLNVLKMSTDLNALSEMQRKYAKDEEFKELIPYIGQLGREVFDIDQSE